LCGSWAPRDRALPYRYDRASQNESDALESGGGDMAETGTAIVAIGSWLLAQLKSLETKDWITFAIAVAGLILGIVNYRRSIVADRVHLRVTPGLAWRMADGSSLLASSTRSRYEEMTEKYGQPILTIHVVNVGKIAASITQIGFCITHPDKGVSTIIAKPFIDRAAAWPTRLEPKSAIRYHVPHDHAAKMGVKYIRAYATTACGVSAIGTSDAFKHWLKLRKKELAGRGGD
jgi:hypothetical protein